MSTETSTPVHRRFLPYRRAYPSLAHVLSLMHNWRLRDERELAFLLPRVQRAVRNVPPEYGVRATEITRAFLMHMGAYRGYIRNS